MACEEISHRTRKSTNAYPWQLVTDLLKDTD
jgi:hypothetical protein